MDQIGNAAPQGAPPNLEQTDPRVAALAAARAQQQGAQQGTGPVGGGPDVGDMLGQLGHAILTALETPRNLVQTGLGNLMNGGGQEGFRSAVDTTAQSWRNMGLPNVQVPATAALAPVLGPLAPLAAGLTPPGVPSAQVNPGEVMAAAGPAATEAQTDPLLYFGQGIPGAAVKGAEAIGLASKAAPLMHALEALEMADNAYKSSAAAVISAPFKAAGGLLGAAAGELPVGPVVRRLRGQFNVIRQGETPVNGVMTPTDTPEAARTLGQWAGSASPETALAQRERQLFDVLTGHLVPRGETLEADAAEYLNARKMIDAQRAAGQPVNGLADMLPAFTGSHAAYPLLQGEEFKLYDAAQALQSPYAKWGALQVINAVEQRTENIWNTLMADKVGSAAGLTGQAARKVWAGLYKDGFEQTMPVYRAGQDAIRRIARQVDAADYPTVPGLDQAVSTLVDGTLQQLGSARYMGLGNGIGAFRDRAIPAAMDPGLRARVGNIEQQAATFKQMMEGAQNQAGQLFSSATGLEPDMARQFLPDFAHADQMVGQRVAELGALKQGLPAPLAGLDPREQGILLKFWGHDPAKPGGYVQQAKTISTGRETLEEGLKSLWDQTFPNAPYPAFDAAQTFPTAANWLAHFNTRATQLASASPEFLQRLGNQEITSGKDFYERFIRGTADTGLSQKIKDAVNTYPAGDLLNTDPYVLGFDQVIRQYAGELNIDQNKVKDILNKANQLYKLQALTSLSYPVGNVLSGLLAGDLAGVNAGKVAGEIIPNLGKMLQGKYEGPAEMTRTLQLLGQALPSEATRAASSATSETAAARGLNIGKPILNVADQLGPVKLGLGGGVLGGLSGAAGTPQGAENDERGRNMLAGAATGAIGGATLPLTAKLLVHNLGGGLEDALRGGAFHRGLMDQLDTDLPAQIAQTALQQGQRRFTYVPGGPSVTGTATPGPQAAQNALDAISSRNGLLSPELLSGVLRQAGVDANVARDAGLQWQGHINDAKKAGTDLSSHAHFDYQNLNNVEQLMKAWFPFSTWATKALPFFAQHILTNPRFLSGLAQLEGESSQQRLHAGFTEASDRLMNAVQIPLISPAVGKVLSGVLGREVTPWYNVLRGFIPFADWGSVGATSGDDDLVSGVLRTMNDAGLPGPGPAPAMILRALTNQPARGLLRNAGPIQGATALAPGLLRNIPGLEGTPDINRGRGIDLNAAQEAFESGIRGGVNPMFHQPPPVDFTQTKIMNRLYEKQIEANHGQGLPSTSALAGPYIEAAAAHQGPLWDEAARQVMQEQGARSLLGWVGQPFAPQATTNPTELSLRGAMAPNRVLPMNDVVTLRRAAAETPGAPVDPRITEKVRAGALQLAETNWADGSLPQGQLPPIMEQLLADPNARNVQQIKAWVDQEYINRNPLAQGYPEAGNPIKQQLQALVQLHNNLPALMMRDPNMKNASDADLLRIGDLDQTVKSAPPMIQQFWAQRNNSQTQLLLKYAKERQDLLAKDNPLLGEWLAYQAEHAVGPGTRGNIRQLSAGSMDEFIKEYLQRQGAGIRR